MNFESQDFQALLAEAGIAFRSTPDFMPCPVRENNVFNYQYAERSPSKELEVRYRFDSFARLGNERKATLDGVEMQASASLDQMHASNFMAIIFNLSGGMFVEPSVLKPETSELLYGADWSALCFMRLANNGFAPDYGSAYILAIHKDGVADVYIIGLYNDIGGEAELFDKNNLPTIVKSNLAPTLRFT